MKRRSFFFFFFFRTREGRNRDSSDSEEQTAARMIPWFDRFVLLLAELGGIVSASCESEVTV